MSRVGIIEDINMRRAALYWATIVRLHHTHTGLDDLYSRSGKPCPRFFSLRSIAGVQARVRGDGHGGATNISSPTVPHVHISVPFNWVTVRKARTIRTCI